uniref:Uncharacterized protein n=1 Tax=viral metagenome TaxID=1070528 RepID=A0A6C0F605_9ZZZZ
MARVFYIGILVKDILQKDTTNIYIVLTVND